MMGNRSGDIDPNLIPYISSKLNLSGEKIIEMLNYQSGFGAISGVSDSRDLEELYFKGENEKAIMAVEMFCYRIAKYISSYFAPLRCIPDALIFTAGIGERSPLKRKIITDYLSEFGFELDLDKNDKNEVIVSKTQSQKKIMVIPTNEELVIAQETYKIIE